MLVWVIVQMKAVDVATVDVATVEVATVEETSVEVSRGFETLRTKIVK